ncbi:hypothetical protein [Nocardioides sp. TF02-7]|nr:hypothetical protein [Nocardioides sp. TF02-7]
MNKRTNKGMKLAIAAVATALAATMGMAAPADAKPTVSARTVYCC